MKLLEFIELPNFTRHVHSYLSDESYQGLQTYLMYYPDAGALVPASGECRKIRWGMEGRGKRGGARIIYYWQRANDEIWMLTIYSKNEEENIPAHILRRFREEIDGG
jgi:mRNA-degrading endonuclease RelE of RelBE toxin-antitoxin system